MLIRHAQSNATVRGVVGGTVGCTGLSPLGREQAERLSDRFGRTNEVRPDVVYASTLPRARETAELAAPGLGWVQEIRSDDELCEVRPGEADGMTWEAYRERYGIEALEPDRPLSPGGESARQFDARVARAVDRLRTEHAGQTIVAFTHGGFIVSATRALLHVPGVAEPGKFWLDPQNTSLTIWAGDLPAQPWLLERYNDAAHLL